jgi:hypothetical protein
MSVVANNKSLYDRQVVSFVAALLRVFYCNLRRGVVAMPIDPKRSWFILSQLTNCDLDIADQCRGVIALLH